jgi:hypothetical protein
MRENLERETVESDSRAYPGTKKKGFVHHLDKVTTSFFITNFPNDATTGDLWKLFLSYARVGEVYIPKKLDKRGRRFGFVKFKEVQEVEVLANSLKDVWLGSFKLWINRSRFARSESKEGMSPKAPQRSLLEPTQAKPGRSFRSVLVGGSSMSVSRVIKVPVNEALCKELKGSMVGLLAREKDVRRIQTTLFMEGFGSVLVTSMGGNMALLRSPVEGDIERLLKSKNECLQYYFSEMKPWNPGLLAVQREVWIQVYGIPLHIWGEELFKLVGNKLGVFMDYDEATARMASFDVARIKILTTTWAFLDVNMKVEVEGVCFDLWVVEERGIKCATVVFGDALEDEASHVVPYEAGDAVDVGHGDGGDLSGEDDASGDETEVDVRLLVQHGGEQQADSDRALCEQVPKGGDIPLTCEKSTNICNSQMEILSVPHEIVGNEETAIKQGTKEVGLAGSEKEVDCDKCYEGGSQGVEESEYCVEETCGPVGGAVPSRIGVDLVSGGPHQDLNSLPISLGRLEPLSDPVQLGSNAWG